MRHRVNHTQYDREREQIERDHMSGLIGGEEYRKLMRELNRDEQDAMREAAERNAEDAYKDTYDQW